MGWIVTFLVEVNNWHLPAWGMEFLLEKLGFLLVGELCPAWMDSCFPGLIYWLEGELLAAHGMDCHFVG